MAVNKITGFRAPYKSDTLRDIVDSIEGLHALLDMDGSITQVGATITVPAFRVVQDGLIYEKTADTTLSAPSLSAPYYLVVTAPTPNPIDDLIFTFAKSPEDVSDTEVILGAYDGFEWREAQKVSIRGILDLLAQTNKDTLRVGPFDGLRTSVSGTDYRNSPGTLVDKEGESQAFNEAALFPIVDEDPDFPRVDRIVYRRPTDYEPRIGTREFLLGGTYDSSPTALTPVEAFDDTVVRQAQKVLIAPDNTGYILSASGSGTNFDLILTTVASDRLSTVDDHVSLATGLTSKAFDAAVDSDGNFHVVFVKSGNILYRKFDSTGLALTAETVIDTQSGECANPRMSIDPSDTKVFVVYQSFLGPANNQIFFTTRTLAGSLITSPKNITGTAQDLITPDIFVSDDLYVYVVWENDTLGSIVYRRFDDIGDALDDAATTVSTSVEQIGVGTLTGNASDPRVLVTGNRELIIVFRQDKGGSSYGISVYTGGAAYMQELTGASESFLSFDVATDPIFNSVMLTAVQAASVDFIKVYDQEVSFVLNLQATGSRGVALARDRLGSLLHAVAAPAAGTFTSYDALTSIIAFGAASIVGSVSTINVDANQFLVEASSLSRAPDIDDRVTITGSAIGGNNVTRLITDVEVLSLNGVDDVYRVTVQNNFTASEDPSTANGDFQAPDGNSASIIKSTSESQDKVFGLFELPSDILLSRMVPPGYTILNWLPSGTAGDLADFLVIGGTGSVDWEKTSAGNLTFTGTVKLSNIFTATEFQITAGSYPMIEGDALYVVLDPSDTSPVPEVTPIPTLPWNEEIGVIGIILDGKFEPSMANLRPLIAQEEIVLGQALPVAIRDRLGVINDVSFEPYTSTEHIDTDDNYQEALSHLDTAVQNILGQISLAPESPISTKVLVSGVDKTLLKGSIFGLKFKERLVDFGGAVIDFQTGTITEEDGTTALGEDFTPVIPAAGMWRWFAVNLVAGAVGADNRLSVKLKITAASSDGATKADAPRATFTNQPDAGQVAVFSSDGTTIAEIDHANLLNLLTNFSTSESAGGAGAGLILSGAFTYDWDLDWPSGFVFDGTMRIQDPTSNVTWLPVAGSYELADGEALYVLLDPSDLTPTPQIGAFSTLETLTQSYIVLGTSADGKFVSGTPNLETLQSGERRVFGESLPAHIRDRAGFSSDVAYDAYTSPKSINSDDSYPEAISNLDTAINQILEQISIRPESPESSRVIITGASKTLLGGTALGLQVENLLVDFEGAIIDFETGDVYESDGLTPLGNSFTPVIPVASEYQWLAVNLEPILPTADNRVTFKIIVTPALTSGASMESAPRAEFSDDPKVGQVAVFSSDGTGLGNIEAGHIVNLLTLDVGSGGGSATLKLLAGEALSENDLVYISPGDANGDTGRVGGAAYLVDAGNGSPELAEIRSRAVGFVKAGAAFGGVAKVQTGGLKKNIFGLTPGAPYYADPATAGGLTAVKPSGVGEWVVPIGTASSATELVINPSMPPDSYAVAIEVDYTSALVSRLEDQLQESIFELLTPVDFSVNLNALLDGTSTGSYGSGIFAFTGAGETMVSANLFDEDEFLADPSIPGMAEATVFWDPDGVDESAVYEISRDGGANWQTLDLERVGLSGNAWTGSITFAEEADSAIGDNSAAETSAYELDDASQTVQSTSFTLADAAVLRTVDLLDVLKTGSPAGSFFIDICEDNSGSPGSVLASSTAESITDAASGTVSAPVSDVALKAGETYWIVVRTDAVYKASFGAGVTAISLSLNGDGLRMTLKGYPLDLRLRVTSSASGKALNGFGVLYAPAAQFTGGGVVKKDVKSFLTITDNSNEFALNFLPDPDLLNVFHIETGQVYRYPAFALSGQTVTFPEDTFLSSVDETVTLVFQQTEGTSFDNSDKNAALLAANFLGSADVSIDRSQPGRGIFLRRPDGTLREICIDDSDNIVIYSV